MKKRPFPSSGAFNGACALLLLLALAVLATGATGHTPARAENAEPGAIEVTARPIRAFRIGSSEARFGPLEFVGGLEMTSRAREFGGISGFRFLAPGGRFVGVTDSGYWLFGTLGHGAAGEPLEIGDVSMAPIRGREGRVTSEKWVSDAEALAVAGDRVSVGFERAHRISEFRFVAGAVELVDAAIDFLVPAYELRSNRGFETLVHAPPASPLAGARVAITERSIDTRGNSFAAVLEGPLKGVFTVARSDDFDVTDGAFLPDGDLLLLERRFSIARGVAMRLRRIAVDTIRPGSVVDGPVLFEADMGYQIDNMEALDVWQRTDGATMISLMSDDNHSILQRNLYLEFRLVGD